MRWARLPARLEQALQDLLQVGQVVPSPLCAALGVDNSYFILFENASAYHNAPDEMRTYIENMQDTGRPIEYIGVSTESHPSAWLMN